MNTRDHMPNAMAARTNFRLEVKISCQVNLPPVLETLDLVTGATFHRPLPFRGLPTFSSTIDLLSGKGMPMLLTHAPLVLHPRTPEP